MAAFEDGRYGEAIEWADRSLRDQPTHLPALRLKAAACGLLRKLAEAHEALRRLLELHPEYTVATFTTYGLRFMPPEVVALYAEGLRKAGLPEE